MGMATDYDAPRKTDDGDTESIQALQERVPDKLSGVVDGDAESRAFVGRDEKGTLLDADHLEFLHWGTTSSRHESRPG